MISDSEHWLTTKDVSRYLQLSEKKIRHLIKHGQIPFHNNHGFLRFHRAEIDAWMKTPAQEISVKSDSRWKYRGKPIRSFMLSATKILIGKKPWERLIEFMRNVAERSHELAMHDRGRNFLYRGEFALFSNNYNDYLKVCCHLGLIEKKQGEGRKKHYAPTRYAEKMAAEKNPLKKREIILESIINLVKNHQETTPDERHSVLLLWFYLTLKEKGVEPGEPHFRRNIRELSYFPTIRLNFAKSLCEFLFDRDGKKALKFIREWNHTI